MAAKLILRVTQTAGGFYVRIPMKIYRALGWSHRDYVLVEQLDTEGLKVTNADPDAVARRRGTAPAGRAGR